GAYITIWRYVPDIRDSMLQRIGDSEYFSRLVVDIEPGQKPAKPGKTPHIDGEMKWNPPLTMSEFLAKQVIMRARREGAEQLIAHADLSEPATLGVVVENWTTFTEEGGEEAAKMADAVHKSAQKVVKGYR